MSEPPPDFTSVPPPPDATGAEAGVTDAGDRQRGSGPRPSPLGSGIAPGARWGRFLVRSQIGQGGMGTVYAADDPSLGRKVALKLVRYDDPAQVERFLQEAKTQAQVEHENVCKVYEVGEVRGRPYIAMQFIEGEPLHRAAVGMSVEERVALMRQVCEAVHAAHRLGLIHRDIKPGNVMVERGEGGRAKAFVCDFGLAREVGSRGMTVTGLALGTPEYMAPEQAFGDTAKLDLRTDVYGLGATLYEILSGRKPYEGDRSAEILVQLMERDPRPLLAHQPNLPVDLQTIVMKCLERDPARRYPSARALGEDLGRFLDGEPIDARPTTLVYRLRKKMRKNKTVAAVLGVSLLAIAGLAALGLRGEWRARQRSALAQRYGLVAKEIEGVMRYGRLLPLHDTRREGELVRRRMAEIRAEMSSQGELGVGAARYALGRGHLALQEHEAARRELEEAWRLGYRGPEVAYALAQAVGELYRRATEELRGLEDPALRASQESELDRRFREPLAIYLGQAAGLEGEAPEYVEGLVAFYEQRPAEAIAKAQAAARRLPWFYEASKLEGDVHERAAIEAQDRGDLDAALAAHALAGRAYAAGLETARSDGALYGAECARRRALAEITQARGDRTGAAYRVAIAACESALAANPDDAQVHIATADVYWRLAEQQVASGEDPRDALERNLAAAREAARLRPTDARAHHALGIAYTLAAERAIDVGADPNAALDEAVANLRRAIQLNPGLSWSYNALGWAGVRRAEWQLARGEDVRPTVAAAAEALEESFRRAPDFYKPMKNLAALYRLQAEYEIDHGLDAGPAIARALDGVERARSVNAEAPVVFELTGEIEILAARLALAQGRDPAPALGRARAALASALRINPSLATAERALANTLRLEAAVAAPRSAAAGQALAQAQAAIERSLRLNARSPESHLERGRIALARGDRRAARAAFEHVLEQRPGDRAAEAALRAMAIGTKISL